METIKQDDRNYLLDNLKGLLMFLVVFGHSLELYKNESLIIETAYMFIYLFHMPVFVFISGYFSKNVDKCRESAFKTFFIPFLIFNTFWNSLAAIFTGSGAFSFITPGWALWYLMSMFFWRIFIKDLARVRYILPISIIVGLGAGIFSEFDSLLALSRTLVFLPFFLAGYFTTEDHLSRMKKPTRLFSFFITILALAFATLASSTDIIPVEFLYGSDSFGTFTVPIWLGLTSRALLYIIGFSFVFVLINVVKSSETFFSKIGSNTFSIYILHTYLLFLVFAVNFFIPYMPIRVFIGFISSIGIVFVLSRDRVNEQFLYFLQKVTSLIIRK